MYVLQCLMGIATYILRPQEWKEGFKYVLKTPSLLTCYSQTRHNTSEYKPLQFLFVCLIFYAIDRKAAFTICSQTTIMVLNA